MLFVVRVSVGWSVLPGEGSIVVGPGEAGSRGCRRVGFAEVGVWMVEWVGRPDCSTSWFCFGLSWTTTLLAAVWKTLTTLVCSSGNLPIRPVNAASQQKCGKTDLDGWGPVTGAF